MNDSSYISNGTRAKKHLGQHFLTSQKALFDMVTAGEVHSGDLVLEIGPGKGVLTKELLEKGAQVIAIEKDSFKAEKYQAKIAIAR